MNRKSLSWNVKQVCTMINKQTITFDNPIQRPSGQWKESDASLLIHSILTMFIPDIYALVVQKINDEGKSYNTYDIIDGKQRLTIVNKYRQDGFSLTNLPPVTLESTNETFDISGLKFSELPESVQDEINGYTLTFKVIELEEGEDEEEIVAEIFYRLNNGSPMSKAHLALVCAKKNVQSFVHDTIANNRLFTNVAHFAEGSIKKSDREITVLQSILVASDVEWVSFATKDVERAFEENDITEETLNKVTVAYDIIQRAFDCREKFISKTSIPAIVALIVNNDYNSKIIPFLKDYTKTTKKNDLYRRFCVSGTAKRASVDGRIGGLQQLYDAFNG